MFTQHFSLLARSINQIVTKISLTQINHFIPINNKSSKSNNQLITTISLVSIIFFLKRWKSLQYHFSTNSLVSIVTILIKISRLIANKSGFVWLYGNFEICSAWPVTKPLHKPEIVSCCKTFNNGRFNNRENTLYAYSEWIILRDGTSYAKDVGGKINLTFNLYSLRLQNSNFEKNIKYRKYCS